MAITRHADSRAQVDTLDGYNFKHDNEAGETGVQVPFLPHPGTSVATRGDVRVRSLRLQSGTRRTFDSMVARTTSGQLLRHGEDAYGVETRARNLMACGTIQGSVAGGSSQSARGVRQVLAEAKPVPSVQEKGSQQGFGNVLCKLLSVQGWEGHPGEAVTTARYSVVAPAARRLYAVTGHSVQRFSRTVFHLDTGRNVGDRARTNGANRWDRCRDNQPVHTLDGREDKQPPARETRSGQTCASSTRVSAKEERISQPQQGTAQSSENPRTDNGSPPRQFAQALNSIGSRKPSDSYRGFECAQHGSQSEAGAFNFGCVMVAVPNDVGVQGRLVWARGGSDRQILPLVENVLNVWSNTAEDATEHSRVDVLMRRSTRSRCQCSKEYKGVGAQRLGLRRWCETASQLMRGGNR